MNEAILKVLSDETLETNESKADAIKKELATITIPKEKFNDLSQ